MDTRSSIPAFKGTIKLVSECGNVSESYDDVLQKIAKYYLTHAVHQNVVSKEKEASASNARSNTNPIGETGDAN